MFNTLLPARLAFLTLAGRNLRTRWVRTALTVTGIIVGVAAIVAVSATNASTLSAINRFFDEASGRSDLLVEASVAGEGFDAGALNVVGRFPAVEAAAPSLRGVVVPTETDDEWEQNFSLGGSSLPGSSFWLMGIDPAVDAEVHLYERVDGRLLQSGEERYSVVLVQSYAEDQSLVVGDDFAVLTPAGEVTLRVVGLIAKRGIGVTNEGAIGFVPLDVAQTLLNGAGQFSQIDLVVAESVASEPDDLAALRREMQGRLGDGFDVKYPASRGEVVTGSIETYQLGLNFFSVVSLFVGSFLIYNAFAMTVVERTREIGMLRAVGMTRRQVLGLVLAEALALGVLGALIGVAAGLLLARGLIVSVAGLTGQPIETVAAEPSSLAQAFAVGVAVTLLAALLPAIQAARVSPLQALRIEGSVDEGRWVEVGLKFGPLLILLTLLVIYRVPLRQEVAFTISSNSVFLLLVGATLCVPILSGGLEWLTRPLIRAIFGNEGRLGSSNINRARGRTTLTVAALMVGISMVIGIQGMTESFETDLNDWVATALGGDLFVESPVEMPVELETRLLARPEIAAVTKTRYAPSRLTVGDDEEFAVFIAIDPATYLAVRGLRIEEGPAPAEVMAELAAGDAVLVGADTANLYDIAVGDVIRLETRRGQRPFRVAAIIVNFAGGELTTLTGSWSDLRRYYGLKDVSSFGVRLEPGASLTAVTRLIEEEIGRGLSLSVVSQSEFQASINELSAEAFALFDVLGLIGLVVAALGVINTMLMNVFERTRELGGLRSLGMTQGQVRRMILAEAVAIGLIGAIFGVAFGVILSDIFITGLRSIGGYVLTGQTPYGAMVVSFFIAVAVAVVAALYPAVRAGRVNIIEAIKTE